MLRLLIRAPEVAIEALFLADSVAQKVPGYRCAKGAILDTVLGKPETFSYTSTVTHN